MKIVITKREICRNSVKAENWKEAFKLAKDFDALFSEQEIEKIQIAYECLTGNESFYKMLKYDVNTIIAEAKIILSTYVSNYDSKD